MIIYTFLDSADTPKTKKNKKTKIQYAFLHLRYPCGIYLRETMINFAFLSSAYKYRKNPMCVFIFLLLLLFVCLFVCLFLFLFVLFLHSISRRGVTLCGWLDVKNQ